MRTHLYNIQWVILLFVTVFGSAFVYNFSVWHLVFLETDQMYGRSLDDRSSLRQSPRRAVIHCVGLSIRRIFFATVCFFSMHPNPRRDVTWGDAKNTHYANWPPHRLQSERFRIDRDRNLDAESARYRLEPPYVPSTTTTTHTFGWILCCIKSDRRRTTGRTIFYIVVITHQSQRIPTWHVVKFKNRLFYFPVVCIVNCL